MPERVDYSSEEDYQQALQCEQEQYDQWEAEEYAKYQQIVEYHEHMKEEIANEENRRG